MNVSIIIVNYNGYQFTRQCLDSLFRTQKTVSFEVILVDNNSTDRSRTDLPKEFPAVKFLWLSENKGFGYANNRGAEIASGNHLFFVNNDTLFTTEIVGLLTEKLSAIPNAGIVSPKLLNEDLTFQLSFGSFPTIKNEFQTKQLSGNKARQGASEPFGTEPVQVDWVTGAALMIKKDLFTSIGGFDERFFMYFEDIELCRKGAGKQAFSFVVPQTQLIHFGGKSYGRQNERILFEYRRSQLRYYDKHNSIIQRILVRMFLSVKFLPGMFSSQSRNLSAGIFRLIFVSNSEKVRQ